MGSYYERYTSSVKRALEELIITNSEGKTFSHKDGFSLWIKLTKQTQSAKRIIFLVGNGASAAMASHMALDLTKNGKVNALAFNDIAYLTAISNDIGYDNVFSFPLSRFACKNDLLVTISSSGNSKNIIEAIKAAHNVGIKVVTLLGMKPDNLSRNLGDLNFYIPAKTYGIVESAHQVLLHCWLDESIDKEKG